LNSKDGAAHRMESLPASHPWMAVHNARAAVCPTPPQMTTVVAKPCTSDTCLQRATRRPAKINDALNKAVHAMTKPSARGRLGNDLLQLLFIHKAALQAKETQP
jgi:hypothetical protein